MIGVLASALVIAGASALVGQAALRLCGERTWRGYAPAIGFSLLMAVAAGAIRLPGRDVTAAALCGLLALVAVAVLARSGGSRWKPDRWLVLMSVAVLALAAIPFVVNGRVGLLGVGFNNDMANHLMWTLSLAGGDGQPVPLPGSGYPLGSHAVVAALSAPFDLDPGYVFDGLLVATALMTAWAALAGTDGLSRPRAALLGVLVGMPYLVAAYYSQAAFKETTQAMLVLAFILVLRDLWREPERRAVRGLLVGVLVGASALNYGHPGLVWFVVIPLTWAIAHMLAGGRAPWHSMRERTREVAVAARSALPVIGLAAVAAVVLVIAELPRLGDFLREVSFSPSGTGILTRENVGNLAGELSPYEAFGLWPEEDFRSTDDPFVLRQFGAVAFGVALASAVWWRRRNDLTLPAAAAACFGIYLVTRWRESAYVSAKALVILAPVVMLMGGKALLAIAEGPVRRLLPAARYALVAVFVGVALLSSVLALRGAAVEPRDHGDELRSLRGLLEGERVLFLGHDDFVHVELDGAIVTDADVEQRTPVTSPPTKRFSSPDPLDFDSVTPASLDRFRYVITTGGAYQSEPPANFALVRTTPSYRVWERRGATPPRRVLQETLAPGDVLDCGSRGGRALSRRAGWARVRPRPILSPRQPGMAGGGERTVPLLLPAGDWRLSLQYVSPQAIDLHPRGIGGAGERAGAPANLDLPGPYWPAGRVPASGSLDGVELRLDAPSPLAPASQRADIGRLAAVRTDVPGRLLPLRRACGRYVDWYTLGRERPPVRRVAAEPGQGGT